MAQDPAEQNAPDEPRKPLLKLLLPVAGVAGALALLAVVYLGYDIVKDRMAPCEGIFRQASVGMSTKISFLKAVGELKLGPDKVAVSVWPRPVLHNLQIWQHCDRSGERQW